MFDFVICALTVAACIAEVFVTVPGSPSFLRVFRTLRLLRVFRFIPRLHEFIDTLLFVIPSALNVLMLLLVVWYIFAVVGMNFMGKLPQCDDCSINRRANFGTFGKSLLTVFVLMTGDGWSDFMVEAAQENKANYLYFMLLTVYTIWLPYSLLTSPQFFVMLIMLNLFIAVVMEEFSSFKNTRHERLKLDNFKDFAILWERKDPYGERRIPALELVPMLWAMGEPLGFSSNLPLRDMFNALQLMDVPMYPDLTVRYEHVLQGLIRWGLKLDMGDMKFNYKEKGITGFTVAHLYATQTLQKVYRRRRAMRLLHRAVELNAKAKKGQSDASPPQPAAVIEPIAKEKQRVEGAEVRKKKKKKMMRWSFNE